MGKWIYGRYKKKVVSGTLSIASSVTTGFVNPRGSLTYKEMCPCLVGKKIELQPFEYWDKDVVFQNDRNGIPAQYAGSLWINKGVTTEDILNAPSGTFYSYPTRYPAQGVGVWVNDHDKAYEILTNNLVYGRGEYVDTVIAEDGTYPDDGVQGDYWYVRTKRAFPEIKIVQNGVLKTAVQGYVVQNGTLKTISKIYVVQNGQLKEVK